MKKLLFLLSFCFLFWCTTNTTEDNEDGYLDYEWELEIQWVWSEISMEATISDETLAVRAWFEDHTDHIFFLSWWSDFLSSDDALPGNKVYFKGKVNAIDAAAWNHYYEVVSIDSLGITWYPDEDRVKELFDTYSYCEVDEDCVDFYPGCPLWCSTPVNLKYSSIAQAIADNYRNHQEDVCMYKCMEVESIKCVDYKCSSN
jgi:hypothetical protein